jgi:hypothetical protein
MKKRELIVRVVLYIMVAGGTALGLLYLLTPTLMPYHLRFLGHTQDQLEPRTAQLFLYLLRVIGSASLAMAIATLLLAGRFARGDNLIRWAVLVMVVITALSGLGVAFSVGSGAPWWLFAAEIVLVFFVFFFSKHRMTAGS